MAREKTGGAKDKSGTFSKDVKVADIHVASASLADAKDHSLGYDTTMQHHINRGSSERAKRGGSD